MGIMIMVATVIISGIVLDSVYGTQAEFAKYAIVPLLTMVGYIAGRLDE